MRGNTVIRTVRWASAFVTAFVFVLTLACEGEPLGADSGAEITDPTFNFTNGPSTPGFIILREEREGGFGRVFNDFEKGISSLVGFDVVEVCTGGPEEGRIENQFVDTPNELDLIIRLAHGDDMPTSVWPFVIEPADGCASFLTTEPLATGESNLRLTDNVDLSDLKKNGSAFGWMSHGKLSGPDGETVNYSAHTRCVVVTSVASGFRFHCSEKVNVH